MPLVGRELCITLKTCGDPSFGSAPRLSDAAIRHATNHPLVVIDLDPDSDPPKQLAIGPDEAGNLLEVIVLLLDDDRLLAIHVMPLRPIVYDLLPGGEDPDA